VLNSTEDAHIKKDEHLHNEGIRKNSDGIADEIRKAQRQLDILLRKAKSTLIALNIELHEEHVERSSPIALPSASYAVATSALSGLPRSSGVSAHSNREEA
jgi:hypothetical protein